MKIQEHVIYSIDAFDRKEQEHALMHACIAIEGTACNLFSLPKATNTDYKKCIRQYYWLIQYFLGGGIDLQLTKFAHLTLDNGHDKLIKNPDLADVIYHIFRCNTAHSKAIPINYQLLPSDHDISRWSFGTGNTLQMPETIIWALLAVSVFSKANMSLQSDGDYFLSWGTNLDERGITKFVIKDNWGKEENIKSFLAPHKQTYVDIKNLEDLKDKS